MLGRSRRKIGSALEQVCGGRGIRVARTCCKILSIFYISNSTLLYLLPLFSRSSVIARNFKRGADPSENLHKLSISSFSSSSSSTTDPERQVIAGHLKRDAAITFPSSRRRRRYSLPANNNAWVGWAGFQTFLSVPGSCEIHTTVATYDTRLNDQSLNHWDIDVERSALRYYVKKDRDRGIAFDSLLSTMLRNGSKNATWPVF